MSTTGLIILLVVVLLLCGGGWGYYNRGPVVGTPTPYNGFAGGYGIVGLVVGVIVLIIVLRLLGLF